MKKVYENADFEKFDVKIWKIRENALPLQTQMRR